MIHTNTHGDMEAALAHRRAFLGILEARKGAACFDDYLKRKYISVESSVREL